MENRGRASPMPAPAVVGDLEPGLGTWSGPLPGTVQPVATLYTGVHHCDDLLGRFLDPEVVREILDHQHGHAPFLPLVLDLFLVHVDDPMPIQPE